MLSESAFRGHVLEELLAKALAHSGFKLLGEPKPDDVALYSASNGLRVRGRGADHQVDVLGQLDRPIPFSFPVRLFVEAKFHSEKVGLAAVRSAMGVINDVNQHYSSSLVDGSGPPPQRYTYHCAMFSASGFTEDAQKYATIHQISLHDLRGESYGTFLVTVRKFAHEIYMLVQQSGLPSFPLSLIRSALRRALGTANTDEDSAAETDVTFTDARDRAAIGTSTGLGAILDADRLAEILSTVAEFDEALYLGFTDSPFAALVKPDDRDAFAGMASRETRPVRLAFAPDDGEEADTGEWALVDQGGDVIRLALPPALDAVLLGENTGNARRAQKVMSVAVGDSTVDLVFDSLLAERSDQALPNDYSTVVRRRHADPALTYRRRREPTQPGWTAPAVRRLIGLLTSEGWPHAEIIVEAARLGGSIDRETVYTMAKYPPSRTLRGFTRPVKRIQRRLVNEGLIPADAPDALITIYDHGVLAKRFQVPDEFQEVLADWHGRP